MANCPAVDRPAELRRALLAWFAAAARDLPWRRRRTLYGTWISEMMLQQTTVATVVPFWERFMGRFPTVAALAAADEAEVLAHWSGLGYYRRARLLHEAARRVVAAGGQLPQDRAGWAALPGVGEYASGAVASIGLGEPVAALDANARRVLTRWVTGDPRRLAELTPAALRRLGQEMVPADCPGRWNEAVMELGATACRARSPLCGSCPVAEFCRAGAAGTAERIPPPAQRRTAEPVLVSLLVVRRGADLALMPTGAAPAVAVAGWGEPVREDFAGLHRGLWGLPSTPWYGSARPEDWSEACAAAWARWCGGTVRSRGRFRHAITRYRLEVQVHELQGGPQRVPAPAIWTRSGPAHPLSALAAKALSKADCTSV